MVSGAKLACDVVVNVTTPGGGDTTNIDGLEFEVTGYGKPTFTPAQSSTVQGGLDNGEKSRYHG